MSKYAQIWVIVKENIRKERKSRILLAFLLNNQVRKINTLP